MSEKSDLWARHEAQGYSIDRKTTVHLHQTMRDEQGRILPNSGPSDPLKIMDKCNVPKDLSGMTVLDVGCYNGAAMIECARRGAMFAVGIDILDPDVTGIREHIKPYDSLRYEPADITNHDHVLDLAQEDWDVVLFFGVLYHLRNPLLALDNIRYLLGNNPKKRLYVETHYILGNDCSAKFYPTNELNNDPTNWFGPTISCVEAWLQSSRFSTTYRGNWTEGRACFEAIPK